ncbi:MAG TPA: hypothetical protein VN577_21220 [Terriglobales bacterium]|nr:hypothetical protein [Terriglobales bacterium]
MPAAMNPPSELVFKCEVTPCYISDFLSEKRFAAFLAGFLPVFAMKAVEIRVFGDEVCRMREKSASERPTRVYSSCLWKPAKNAEKSARTRSNWLDK